jgi:hypothetical protein
MPSPELAQVVERGDLDELIRLIDGYCDSRDWDRLAELRERCRSAHERSGRQLWPAATHAEYRLALEAPGPWAAAVLEEGAGRFAPGPLSEVAASAHTWDELAPHVPPGPLAVLTAHERAVRGDDLTGVAIPGPPVLDLPLRLERWEPAYFLAEYHAHRTAFPGPQAPVLDPVDLPANRGFASRRAGEDIEALLGVTGAWTTASAGRADAVAVDGDALTAIAGLGAVQARVAGLAPAQAMATLAWAAASGGAHGHRPGAAPGRFAAWWVVGALGELLDSWPPDSTTVGEVAARLRWFWWDEGAPVSGWAVRIAVEDPATGRAWALAGHDPG